jgi:hypothetical protein
MERQICEPDWKRLRTLEPVALDRFYRRVLTEIARLTSDDGIDPRERYRAILALTADRERELAAAFDGLRRSTALVQLARMRSLRLLTDDEFATFTDETRAAVELFLEMWRG